MADRTQRLQKLRERRRLKELTIRVGTLVQRLEAMEAANEDLRNQLATANQRLRDASVIDLVSPENAPESPQSRLSRDYSPYIPSTPIPDTSSDEESEGEEAVERFRELYPQAYGAQEQDLGFPNSKVNKVDADIAQCLSCDFVRLSLGQKCNANVNWHVICKWCNGDGNYLCGDHLEDADANCIHCEMPLEADAPDEI
jgi:hypothetical protein